MSSRIVDLRSGVVAGIKATIPSLRSCEAILGRFALEDLLTTQLAPPAVRVGTPLVEPKITAAAQHEANVQIAAFCLADGRDGDRDVWTMAEAIALMLVPDCRWGLQKIGAPSDIRIVPILAGERQNRGVSMVAVSWSQTLNQLGTNMFNADGVLVEGLYLNGEDVTP